jgi:ATP-binding cassette subfamily F protein 3
VDGGGISGFDGDIGDYRDRVLGRSDDTGSGKSKPSTGKQARRRDRAAERKRIAPLRKQVRDAESRIAALQARQAALETELAKPGLYQERPDRVIEINKAVAMIKEEIVAAEGLWLALQGELDSVDAPADA